jgi:hypothetical protein
MEAGRDLHEILSKNPISPVVMKRKLSPLMQPKFVSPAEKTRVKRTYNFIENIE